MYVCECVCVKQLVTADNDLSSATKPITRKGGKKGRKGSEKSRGVERERANVTMRLPVTGFTSTRDLN